MRTGLLLVVLFGTVRMLLVLQANVTGSYQVVSVVFVAMALLPVILLTRTGRRRVGLEMPARWRWMLAAALAGAAASLLTFGLFSAAWGDSLRNAFVYIGGTYSVVPDDVSAADRAIYFVIFAVIGLTFSPIGEELLYRGIVHESLATQWGAVRATLTDAAAFAMVHLAHFGIIYAGGGWSVFAAPALLWVVMMFASSLVFTAFRRLTGSVAGAIVSHAGFNLAMTVVIFYGLDLF